MELAIARLHRIGIPAAFSFTSKPDAKRSSRTIAELYQGGLGLPDRDYYTKTDSASEKIRSEYVQHVAKMLRLSGRDSSTAAASAQKIMELETALAQASMTREAQRDPESIYHLTRSTDLAKLTPHFSWQRYFSSHGLKNVNEINVAQPAFMSRVDSLLASTPVEDWREYLRWMLIANTAPALSSPFAKESFRFNSTILRGVSEMRPRWKRCLAFTDQALGEVLGQAYVRKNFTPEAKARALEMVRNIRAELRTRLGELAWMSPETKRKAYAKLEAIINKIGYPDTWRDYSRLETRAGTLCSQSGPSERIRDGTRSEEDRTADRPTGMGNDAADRERLLQPEHERNHVPGGNHAAAVFQSEGR